MLQKVIKLGSEGSKLTCGVRCSMGYGIEESGVGQSRSARGMIRRSNVCPPWFKQVH